MYPGLYTWSALRGLSWHIGKIPGRCLWAKKMRFSLVPEFANDILSLVGVNKRNCLQSTVKAKLKFLGKVSLRSKCFHRVSARWRRFSLFGCAKIGASAGSSG